MYCTKCGKEMEDYQVCGRDVQVAVILDHYDPKRGKKVFRLYYDHMDGIYCSNLRKHYQSGSQSQSVINKPVKENEIINGYIVLGKCKVLCCPNCGDIKPSNGGGCFIATAVYGSALAEEVILLRKFRDEILVKSKAGRAFTTLYYKLSPSIANLIVDCDFLKVTIKMLLVEPIIFLVTKFGQPPKEKNQ